MRSPVLRPRRYRAPEVVLGLPYGPAVDVWAVGCVLAEMLTGHPLFPGTTALDQLYMQHAGVGGLAAEQAAIMRGHPDYAKVRADFHARHLQRATAAPAGRRGGGPAAIETVFERCALGALVHVGHHWGCARATSHLAVPAARRLAPHMSRTMMHFFKMCLHPDPARRATAAQLLDTPFIREGAWQQQAAAGPSAGPHHHHSRPHTTSHALDGGRQAPLGAAAAPPLAQRSDHCSQQAPRGGGSRPGPTVLHRRAADVCKLLDSDQDDEETLGRLAAALPGGVPLSDSDSEADDAGARAGGEEPPPRRHALPVSSSLLRAQGSRLHTTFVGGDAFAAPGAERSSSGHAQRASARAHAVVAGGAAELDDRLSHRHGRATHMPSSASAPHCAVSVATAAVCRPPPAATTISAPGLASGGVEQGSFRTPPQAPCAPEASDAPGGGWHQSCAPEARPPPQQPPIQQGACGTSGRTYLPLASSSAALLPSRPSVKPPTPGAAPPVRSSFGDAPAPAAAAAPSLPSVLAPAPPSAGVVAAAAIMQATGMLEAAPRADWAEHCGPRSVGHLPEGRLGGEGGLQPPPQCPPPPGGTPHVTRGGPPGALVADPAAEGAPPTPPGPSKEEQAGHARVVVVVPGVGVPRAAQYLGQWSMQVSGRLQKLAPPHGAALPTAGPAVGPVTGDAQPAVDLQRGG